MYTITEQINGGSTLYIHFWGESARNPWMDGPECGLDYIMGWPTYEQAQRYLQWHWANRTAMVQDSNFDWSFRFDIVQCPETMRVRTPNNG